MQPGYWKFFLFLPKMILFVFSLELYWVLYHIKDGKKTKITKNSFNRGVYTFNIHVML